MVACLLNGTTIISYGISFDASAAGNLPSGQHATGSSISGILQFI